ncbi:putative SOS response-associated peptidase YedK [Bradyrhizobium sp. S3.14.4]
MEPGTGRRAIAATFEAAREAFEAAWSELRLTVPEAAFAEWRRDRDWRAAMAAKRARGEKRDSEIR